MTERVFLSRRNLMTLLSKLDRADSGETACTIIKNDFTHPKYPQTVHQIIVTAVEDDEYYKDRCPGTFHPIDEANISK